jgi:signal transduction histidine kinase
MITATVSHEMRTPINAIMTQLDSLDELLQGNRGAQKMTRIIKNSSQLLLYLVNDMLDVYMLKNKKFQIIEDKVRIKKMMKDV